MSAIEAHLRLLAALPVRTHHWTPDSPNKQGRPDAAQTRRTNAAIVALAARGCTRSEIAEKTGVTLATVGRHLRGEHKIA